LDKWHFPVCNSILDSDALIERVLSLYSLGNSVQCNLYRRCMSDVYSVKTQSDSYFLKVYRNDRNSRKNIEAEMDFLNDLLANQIPVSAPIKNCHSAYLNEIDAPEGTRYAVLFHAITGHEPLETNPSHSRSFGKLAGRLHNCADKLGKQYDRKHLDEKYLILDPIGYMKPYIHNRKQDIDYLSKFGSDLIDELCSLLTKIAPEYGICHGDFHAGNALYDSNDQLTLFDFDSFGYGWRIVDLGVYVVSYDWMDLSRESKKKRERIWNVFAEGYSEERPLSENELSAVRLCLPIRHFELMGITIRYWSQIEGINWITDEYFDKHIEWFKKWADEYRSIF